MTKNKIKEFGLNLKKLRLEKKLSQEELANLSGLHRTYIGCVERGEKNITIKNLYKISKALNINIKGLFID